MSSCWEDDPLDRPLASIMVDLLTELITRGGKPSKTNTSIYLLEGSHTLWCFPAKYHSVIAPLN